MWNRGHRTYIQWKKAQNRKIATYNHYQSRLIWVVLFPQPDCFVLYIYVSYYLSQSCLTTYTIHTTPSGQRWTARSHIQGSKSAGARISASSRRLAQTFKRRKNHSPHWSALVSMLVPNWLYQNIIKVFLGSPEVWLSSALFNSLIS